MKSRIPTSATLVAAAFVGVWAQMNYEQLTSLFRVEERSLAFVAATLVNLLVTVGATVILVVGYDQGPLGVIVGNFIGTLVVYLGLLGYRREQLGLQFDRKLLRDMQHFGWPLVPAALALIGINFADRITCPIVVNIGLQDNVCPPETGYALFNRIGAGDKQLYPYDGHGHDGGRARHGAIVDRFFAQHLQRGQVSDR